MLQTEMATQLRYRVLFNAAAGGAQKAQLTEEKLSALFAEAGLEAEIDADGDTPLDDRIEQAVASDADVIVAAGGDGTITALASALAGTDKMLAMLPLGTANLLARDLKVPLPFDEAIAALKSMTPCTVDVGEVNGRVFLHKVVLGLAPAIAAEREKMRDDEAPGAVFRFAKSFLEQVKKPRKLDLKLETDKGGTEHMSVRSIAVANNAYDEGVGQFFCRSCLDSGWLTIYTLSRMRMGDIVRLSFGMLFGRWRKDEALNIAKAHRVTLSSRRPILQVMIDGEVEDMRTPLNFKIRPKALRVLAPTRIADEPIAEGVAT